MCCNFINKKNIFYADNTIMYKPSSTSSSNLASAITELQYAFMLFRRIFVKPRK